MALTEQHKSIASILAIVCAIGAFFTATGHWGFVLGIVAIIFGAVGFLRSASPRVSGGVLSVVAIAIAAIALVYSILRGLIHAF